MSNDIEEQSQAIFADVEYAIKKHLDVGVDKAADRLVDVLEPNSPSDPSTTKNKYKDSWKVNRKYKGVRYVGNTKTVETDNGNIPLSNLLENGENGQPHMRSTFDSIEDELANIIFNEIQF